MHFFLECSLWNLAQFKFICSKLIFAAINVCFYLNPSQWIRPAVRCTTGAVMHLSSSKHLASISCIIDTEDEDATTSAAIFHFSTINDQPWLMLRSYQLPLDQSLHDGSGRWIPIGLSSSHLGPDWSVVWASKTWTIRCRVSLWMKVYSNLTECQSVGWHRCPAPVSAPQTHHRHHQWLLWNHWLKMNRKWLYGCLNINHEWHSSLKSVNLD